MAKVILQNKNILGGIAVVENAYDNPCVIRALTPSEILTEEPKLKELSYQTIARLLFDSCDVLIVDQIGKNISGDGWTRMSPADSVPSTPPAESKHNGLSFWILPTRRTETLTDVALLM